MVSEIIRESIDKLKDSKLSGYQIEQATGISQASISRYRRGLSLPKEQHAQTLIDFFAGKLTALPPKSEYFYQEIISSQQRTIELQAETIKNLTSKNV